MYVVRRLPGSVRSESSDGIYDMVRKLLLFIRLQRVTINTAVLDCKDLLCQMQTSCDNAKIDMNFGAVQTPGPSQPKPRRPAALRPVDMLHTPSSRLLLEATPKIGSCRKRYRTLCTTDAMAKSRMWISSTR